MGCAPSAAAEHSKAAAPTADTGTVRQQDKSATHQTQLGWLASSNDDASLDSLDHQAAMTWHENTIWVGEIEWERSTAAAVRAELSMLGTILNVVRRFSP